MTSTLIARPKKKIASVTKTSASPLAKLALKAEQRQLLRALDVRTPEDLMAAMDFFPLEKFGFDTPTLSNELFSLMSASFASRRSKRQEEGALRRPYGARPPKDSPHQLESEAPLPTIVLQGANPKRLAASTASTSTKKRATTTTAAGTGTTKKAKVVLIPGALWPVRNQGARGTCVSFTMTACVEHAHKLAGATKSKQLSEQFLYWAIKHKGYCDGPNEDGTRIEYALAALHAEGICGETHWPYDKTFLANNISHNGRGGPTANAVKDAQTRRSKGTKKRSVATIRAALDAGRPVGICVPVYGRRDNPDLDNWGTDVAYDFGKILNPFPGTVVTGGHAVCLVGYVVDEDEPNGGYFIFRNSWGTSFGAKCPAATESYVPAKGYGQLSATYVRKFLWEAAVL